MASGTETTWAGVSDADADAASADAAWRAGPALSRIPCRGEFVDALDRLRRGHVLVRVSDSAGGTVLDGAALYHSFETLHVHGLIELFRNPEGFANARYYRLSHTGRAFAERACAAWARLPLWRRLLVRLLG